MSIFYIDLHPVFSLLLLFAYCCLFFIIHVEMTKEVTDIDVLLCGVRVRLQRMEEAGGRQ